MSKPSSSIVVIAHAADAAAEANAISVRLRALGYDVDQDGADRGPRARQALRRRIEAARRLIVLWSKSASRAPEFRNAAYHAKALGALAVVRLDATPVPPGLGPFTINLRPGRAQAFDWSTLMEAAESAPARSTTRGHAFLVALLLGLVTAFAAYQSNPVFASRVDAVATMARDQVEHAVSALKG